MSGECDNCGNHTLECECKWRTVNQNPPPLYKEVLIWAPWEKWESKYKAAHFDGEDFWTDGNSGPIKNIRHWMPLPLPPPVSQ